MYHIVWIPRYRYNVLVDGVDEYLKIKMDEVRKLYPEIEYLERNIQSDHVHIVISFPAKYSIVKVVQIIKQNTGRGVVREVRIHQEAVLGTRRDMVGWIFREHSGLGRKDDPGVREVSGERRLRASFACPL
jgi:putative transposase